MHVRIEHGMSMEEYHEERAKNPTSRRPIGTCDSGTLIDKYHSLALDLPALPQVKTIPRFPCAIKLHLASGSESDASMTDVAQYHPNNGEETATDARRARNPSPRLNMSIVAHNSRDEDSAISRSVTRGGCVFFSNGFRNP